MDKVNRLRWIPMMVKAYSDARLRQELQRRGVDWRSVEQTQDAAGTPESTTAPASGKRSVHQSAVRKTNALKHAAKKNPGLSRRPPNIGSVLREVREARKQMRQLESLKAQLADMQTQMDQRMSELLERLNTSGREDARQPSAPGQRDRQNSPLQ